MERKFWIAVLLILQAICTISVIADAQLDACGHVRVSVLCGINLVCAIANIALINKEYKLWGKKSL